MDGLRNYNNEEQAVMKIVELLVSHMMKGSNKELINETTPDHILFRVPPFEPMYALNQCHFATADAPKNNAAWTFCNWMTLKNLSALHLLLLLADRKGKSNSNSSWGYLHHRDTS